jgi:hypothetical protein
LAAYWTAQVFGSRLFSNQAQPGEPMKNPLDSIVGTIIAGFVLTAILYVFVTNFLLRAAA